MHFQMFIKY
nr:unnamed protein product [Callosobruchus analis]CAI5851586.1 unnamed protein product [Callosobruchus analis]